MKDLKSIKDIEIKKKENKDVRLNILTTQTLKDKLKEYSNKNNISMNDVVNLLLEEFLKNK